MQRIAVFASGRGSNFSSLFRACGSGDLPARIVLLLSDRAESAALDFAGKHGIETFLLDSPRKRGSLSSAEEEAFRDACLRVRADWVCLAGFMRILKGPLLKAFPERILNIHPALLPAFPGLEAQRQAFDYGVKVAGCTVHFVDGGVDSGPIVLQRALLVDERDGPESLAGRILELEHALYPEALSRLLTEPWSRRGRRIVFGSGRKSS